MTKHDAISADVSASSKPFKLSKSYGSSCSNTSAINTKENTIVANKRKSEEENGLDIEENGVRLKVKLLFFNLLYIDDLYLLYLLIFVLYSSNEDTVNIDEMIISIMYYIFD